MISIIMWSSKCAKQVIRRIKIESYENMFSFVFILIILHICTGNVCKMHFLINISIRCFDKNMDFYRCLLNIINWFYTNWYTHSLKIWINSYVCDWFYSSSKFDSYTRVTRGLCVVATDLVVFFLSSSKI